MPRKSKFPGQVAPWAPTPVDIEVGDVHPVPGWVILEEIFEGSERKVPGTDLIIHISRPYVHNTMYGKILAIHPETTEETGLDVGEVVVFREYSGGRWFFRDVKTLVTPVKDIYAKVE